MKNIKNFESFNKELNELSTELADRAATRAAAKVFGEDTIGKVKNTRQGNKFEAYINPEFKEKMSSMGFKARKVDNTIILTMNTNELGVIRIHVGTDKYNLENVTAEQIGNSLLAKVNRAIKLTQQELKNSN